eukprot:Rmarinus@m.26773
MSTIKFDYQYDLDENGVFWALGTQNSTKNFQNPALKCLAAVEFSSLALDCCADDILSRQRKKLQSANFEGSWCILDLGFSRILNCTAYTLQHGFDKPRHSIRSWVFEGSNDSLKWVLLREHKDDDSLCGPYATHTWRLDLPKDASYRYFRIRMTGPDSSGKHYLRAGGIELYGTLTDETPLSHPLLCCGCCYNLDDAQLKVLTSGRRGMRGLRTGVSHESPMDETDINSQVIMHAQLWGRLWKAGPAEAIAACPGSDVFPGAVPATAPRCTSVSRIFRSDLRKWQPTGLYAAAGETIVVRYLTESVPTASDNSRNSFSDEHGTCAFDWHVRIGCHSDKLYRQDRWLRWPDVCTDVSLNGSCEDGANSLQVAELKIVSPFGGMIYVECFQSHAVKSLLGEYDMVSGRNTRATRRRSGCESSSRMEYLHVEFSGAVQALSFDARMPGAREMWTNTIQDLKLESLPPWGEIVGERWMATLPTRSLLGISAPEHVTEFWDSAIEKQCELCGSPPPQRLEHFVCDVQITKGAKHSGYPIMHRIRSPAKFFSDPVAKDMEHINVPMLKTQGSWGWLHELGHNRQEAAWTWDAVREVTVNFFTLYATEALVPGASVETLMRDAKKNASKYLQGTRSPEQWRKQPFVALTTFTLLQRRFGWELFKRIFRRYRSEGVLPRSNQMKLDTFVHIASEECGHDLRSYFADWGLHLELDERGRSVGHFSTEVKTGNFVTGSSTSRDSHSLDVLPVWRPDLEAEVLSF